MEYFVKEGKRKGQIRKNFSDSEFNKMVKITSFVKDETRKSIRERVYCILNNILEIPKCKECGTDCSFLKSGKYSIYCSLSCKSRNNDVIKQVECTKKKNKNFNCLAVEKSRTYIKKNSNNNEGGYSRELDFHLLQTSGKLAGKIRRNFCDDEFERIKELTSFIKDQSRKSIRERVYCILNNILEIPKCKECGKNNSFINGKYSISCSQSCAQKSDDVLQKSRMTRLIKYGNVNFRNTEKAKHTCMERYGVHHTSQLDNNRIKAKITGMERYGTSNNIDKIKDTCIERYGVDNIRKAKHIRDKISIKIAKNYQDRRNDEGTDYKGFVYILKFGDNIKIGLTNNFESRVKGLFNDFGNYDIINIIETDECFTLERELHELCDGYRICLEEGSGRTEFFRKECLSIIEGYIDAM